ncbi:hypothetical protein PROFUN_07671 [Planoprotostelium fungivorum]|uniref:Uncharacterized protein n=1 Tax=Planoprotostelium fungivorum TaxID=1890364 RepID=A0A2P6MM48_9EUKA|nr:hypothetical protein PROFUN_07671 [Planoprotostelium fungivorum]
MDMDSDEDDFIFTGPVTVKEIERREKMMKKLRKARRTTIFQRIERYEEEEDEEPSKDNVEETITSDVVSEEPLPPIDLPLENITISEGSMDYEDNSGAIQNEVADDVERSSSMEEEPPIETESEISITDPEFQSSPLNTIVLSDMKGDDAPVPSTMDTPKEDEETVICDQMALERDQIVDEPFEKATENMAEESTTEADTILETTPEETTAETETISETETTPETEIIPETTAIAETEPIVMTEVIAEIEAIAEIETFAETEINTETEAIMDAGSTTETPIMEPETVQVSEIMTPQSQMSLESETASPSMSCSESETIPETEIITEAEITPQTEITETQVIPETEIITETEVIESELNPDDSSTFTTELIPEPDTILHTETDIISHTHLPSPTEVTADIKMIPDTETDIISPNETIVEPQILSESVVVDAEMAPESEILIGCNTVNDTESPSSDTNNADTSDIEPSIALEAVEQTPNSIEAQQETPAPTPEDQTIETTPVEPMSVILPSAAVEISSKSIGTPQAMDRAKNTQNPLRISQSDSPGTIVSKEVSRLEQVSKMAARKSMDEENEFAAIELQLAMEMGQMEDYDDLKGKTVEELREEEALLKRLIEEEERKMLQETTQHAQIPDTSLSIPTKTTLPFTSEISVKSTRNLPPKESSRLPVATRFVSKTKTSANDENLQNGSVVTRERVKSKTRPAPFEFKAVTVNRHKETPGGIFIPTRIQLAGCHCHAAYGSTDEAIGVVCVYIWELISRAFKTSILLCEERVIAQIRDMIQKSLIFLCLLVCVFSDTTFVIVGTNDVGGVLVYRQNGVNLTKVGGGPGNYNSAVSPYISAGGDLYIFDVSEGENTLGLWTLDKNGNINRSLSVASGGADPCFVSVHSSGKFVFVANYDSGHFASFSFSSGNLSLINAIKPGNGRDARPNAHMLIEAPNGLIAGVDLGSDNVFFFNLGPHGELQLNKTYNATAGSGPRHIAFHPTLSLFAVSSSRAHPLTDMAYVVCEEGNVVLSFNYNAAKPTTIQSISTLPPGYANVTYGGEIRISPNYKYLYASNRGADSIAIFSIDQNTGNLALLSIVSSQAAFPRGMNLDPTGSLMYVGGALNNVTSTFQVKDDGSLVYLNSIYTPFPTDYAFVTIRSDASTTKSDVAVPTVSHSGTARCGLIMTMCLLSLFNLL